VQRDSDEDAWRAIVDNYGDRIELEDDTPADPPVDPRAEPPATGSERASHDAGLQRLFRPLPEPPADHRSRDDDLDDGLDDELDDGFVPPPPPPLPKLPPDRFLAWAGLFGSPTILLVCLVFDFRLAPWLGYLLVASFIGGFGYLVAKMPRGEDVDPWDDGARL
jgi:hypothetical protein